VTRKDPGNPDVCNVFTIHQGFSPPDVQQMVAHNCRTAGWGCLDCKRVLADHMIATLAPMRERAAALRADPGRVEQILRGGAAKARTLARATLAEAKRRMGFFTMSED
jgi:tryptophanyl-tRNA synthetase